MHTSRHMDLHPLLLLWALDLLWTHQAEITITRPPGEKIENREVGHIVQQHTHTNRRDPVSELEQARPSQ